VPPRLGEVRKVLTANGFECVRARKHEIWIRRDDGGDVVAKTVLSHGNAEIRTRALFTSILRQSKKAEDEFR
jgi:predicted RNA binding protein YcfA (HicA-like mRNA interferase family)